MMEKNDGVAEAASAMAFRLWRAQYQRAPIATEQKEFLELVAACVKALTPQVYDYAEALKNGL